MKNLSPSLIALLMTIGIAGFGPAQADPVKGVVELFTSQSCSSCPPADKVFGEVIQRGDVIGLAFHVDYWNYLDWKDTFSSAESTKRQRDYAQSLHSSQVYTPQLIVNGIHVVSAGSPGELHKVMDEAGSGAPLPVSVSAELADERLIVKAGTGKGEANLVLAIFEEKETVRIERGENRGKTVEYNNAVTELHTIGMWKGETLAVELPKKEYLAKKGYGCAVFLQRVTPEGTPGEIIGAAIVSGAGA
ncbi:MAG: DUF1223 domain-containing protein [Rhizobiaceae bacterium]